MEKIYNKLVRDKIPEIIKLDGKSPITRVLNEEEYKYALKKKILEEALEVSESNDSNELEELADILEVIMALIKIDGKELKDILEIAKTKHEKRGGFEDKIYLEKVIENE